MTANPPIFISVLTYNSSSILKPLIESIIKQTNQNYKLFVFDNGSSDNIKGFCKKYPIINFVDLKDNTGYSGGNNQAFEYLKKNYVDFKYFLIINPDSYLSENLIEKFYEFISKKPNFTIAAPLIKEGNTFLSTNNFIGPTFTHIHSEAQFGDFYEKVKFNHGFCMLINVEKIKKQLFNDYFMYYEDIQLSVRTCIESNENYVLHNTYAIHESNPVLKPYQVYYTQVNRYKFLIDTFNKKFLFFYFPIYILLRILIFFYRVYTSKGKYYLKEHFLGGFEGLIYFFKQMFNGKENISFWKTIKFCYLKLSQD
jgi:GT2 family glycosyltransferase